MKNKLFAAVRVSMLDAISEEPEKDWKESLGDAIDCLDTIQDNYQALLAALKRMHRISEADEKYLEAMSQAYRAITNVEKENI